MSPSPLSLSDDLSVPEAEEAAAKVVGRLGTHKSAKKLQQRHREMRQPELQAAQLRGVNDGLTNRLDQAKVAEALGFDIEGAKVYNGEPPVVGFVIMGESGRTARRLVSLEELGGLDVLRDASEVATERFVEEGDIAGVIGGLRSEIAELRVAQQGGSPAPTTPPAPEPQPNPAQTAASQGQAPSAEPQADALPFEDYDGLNARDIVDRLKGATDDQKAEVLAYEQAHDGRKTVVEAAGGQVD